MSNYKITQVVLPALVPLHPFPLYSFTQTMESNQFTDLRGGAFKRDKQRSEYGPAFGCSLSVQKIM